MAERRMFSKKITNSDAFLDMPISSRLLYYDLNMNADDDGFVGNPNTIIKITGASGDDLKLLILKRFILVFDTGIIVIKHWKIHNYIQNDRHKSTSYKEELSQLKVKDNKAYTECIQNVSKMYPICTPRLGKVSIDKVRLELGKVRLGEDTIEDTSSTIPYEDIKNSYNSVCKSLSKIEKLTKSRKEKIKVRWNELESLDKFKELFLKVENTPFCKGTNKQGWKASFDWLMENDKNYLKVLEGQYDNTKSKSEEKSNNVFEDIAKERGYI